MQLVINTYGSYLHVKQKSFEIKTEEDKKRVSAKKVSSILITTGAAISTDAVKLALENNIEIQFLDEFGCSLGKVWHPKLGSTTYIRRKQLELAESEEGTELVKEFMLDKIDNMINHLHDLAIKRSKSKEKYINKKIKEICELRNKLEKVTGYIEDVRNTIMGYEGNISRKYFASLSFLLPDRYKFNGRSFRPAEDEFNCLLNYGYGVLYGKVEKALIIAGLDPYVGILHTDGYNKKSFVFDFIEPYRHHIDRVVMKLFSRKKIRKLHFDKIQGGLTLNDEGKKLLLTELNDYFDKKIRYKGREIKINNTIQYDCHSLANRIIEEG
ncbi:CRISPR-associated endonuclease Cas1 [Halothermothrix orenii]|uniref:CRISPR-associated endonuclease Cas1 n=1 Tax=Halothermothrix orenii (strain H 168 / OCM 544 / DSM 9562) TaxID=373903 RepID=B8CYA1_HALOH|nr:CRISPR-associated endonuclease Cas1 [Halothermothrix orenii]ACL70270.1 CRISPR-associated protein Cas1 [Halothermothrix orenii H 168]